MRKEYNVIIEYFLFVSLYQRFIEPTLGGAETPGLLWLCNVHPTKYSTAWGEEINVRAYTSTVTALTGEDCL